MRLKATVFNTKVSSSKTIGILYWRWQVINQDDVVALELETPSLFDLELTS